MIKIKNRCCYTVMLILCGTLFLTGLTGCKSREAQFLIDGLQEAKAEVDAEPSGEEISGKKSKAEADEKKSDAEEMQQAMIYVDVCGAVANPGVFQLAAGRDRKSTRLNSSHRL